MKRKVCILDDDPVTVRLATSVIERSGHEVATFLDVAGAREFLIRQRPQILVLDLQLEGFSGVEVLDWARDLSPFLRVVVITGGAPVTSLLDCWRLGADCCVLKGKEFATRLAGAVEQADKALTMWEDSITGMRNFHRDPQNRAAAEPEKV